MKGALILWQSSLNRARNCAYLDGYSIAQITLNSPPAVFLPAHEAAEHPPATASAYLCSYLGIVRAFPNFVPSQATMASADMPNDGRGGSLYNSPISIPNYANTTLSTSYSAIDGYLFSGSASGTTFGVAFGACLMTLIHVLLFTMPDKRGRVIFNCIVVGLVLEVIRQFCGVWAVTRSGTNSSYFLLTLPPDNATDSELLAYVTANAYTNFSLGTKVNATIDGLTSILAFFTIQVCFYVLVHTMMSARRRKTIRIVTVSLAGVGAHAAVWRFVQFVLNTISVFNQTMNSAPPAWLILVAEVAYAVSICAWCLVYGFLVFRSALARIRLGVEFRRGEARHVMFMTAIESMIVPSMCHLVTYRQKWVLIERRSNLRCSTMGDPILVSRRGILCRPLYLHFLPVWYTLGKLLRSKRSTPGSRGAVSTQRG